MVDVAQNAAPSPACAVVVLAYNHARYLGSCLASLEEVYAKGLQLILIDNGSQDGSAGILKAWQAAHPAATLLLLAHNLGHCKAFNLALKQVRAAYVLDLAGDDYLLPGGLEALVQCLVSYPTAAFCHGNAAYVHTDGSFLHLAHKSTEQIPERDVWALLFGKRFICPPTVLFCTQLLLAAGGYDEALSFEDFDTWMRLARKHTVAYTPAVVVGYRQHAGSASAAQSGAAGERYMPSIVRIIEKAYALAKTKKEVEAIHKFAQYYVRLAAFTGQKRYVNTLAKVIGSYRGRVANLWFWRVLAALPLKGVHARYIGAQRYFFTAGLVAKNRF